jgi:hypothetical protein
MSAWKADALPLGDARNSSVILPACANVVKHISIVLSGYNSFNNPLRGTKTCNPIPNPDVSSLKKS